MTIRNEFILLAALGLLLLALIAAGVQGLPAVLPFLRLLLGLAFVLFAPGYALQAAVFPRQGELDTVDRLALSFGLSVAVIPPVALLLDRLPWGIRLWPIVASEGVLIVAFSAVAWYRRQRLPAAERPVLHLDMDVAGWWAAQDRANRVISGVLAGAVLTATLASAAVIVQTKVGDRLTEFYLLGPEGLAENFPREAFIGQPVTVTVGIANREGVTARYRVEARDGSGPIGQAGPLDLAPDASDERPVIFVPTELGEDVKIEFLLYRDAGAQPYRSLRLWLKVKAGPQSTGSGKGAT